MTKEQLNEQMESLAKSQYGGVLLEYIKEKIDLMGKIGSIKTFEELIGKQEAVKILKDIFRFLETKREPESSAPSKNEYQ
jgi:hypothetical protein